MQVGQVIFVDGGHPGVQALTVASHHKKSHLPARTSSNGPTAFGLPKPDLCAPGVDVWSTVPLPLDAAGVADLFYYVQARRAKLAGANWSLYVALALFVFGALGLIANYGATG